MVPIYSTTTMFSYVWYWHAVYWEVARKYSLGGMHSGWLMDWDV